MCDIDDLFMVALPLVLVVGWIMFLIGLIAGTPTTLENDCIVDNNKIYCEVSNIGRGE